jgi:hypothetical protein
MENISMFVSEVMLLRKTLNQELILPFENYNFTILILTN